MVDAGGDDAFDEFQDVLRVVASAVGIVRDAAALVGFDAVLVDDPIEGGAVAEAVEKSSASKANAGTLVSPSQRSIRSEFCCR